MSDGSLPDRLTQLRSRWEADPASRIFLQLAEEYRHQGRLQEALGVLDQGLREHPGYLSALVAKGRCLLELGQPEPAREVLERVVRQDATQMVANKLLVRTYLETGQAARARERLDLYSLLHDGDPEIEDLRARIQRLDGAPAGGSRLPSAAPGAAGSGTSGGSAEGDVFDLAAPSRAAAPREAPSSADVFDLRPPAAPVPSTVAVSPPSPAPAPPPAPVAGAADEDESEPVADGEPFAGLVSRAVRRRHFAALVAEGIFAFEPPAWAAAAPAAPPVPVSERAEPEPEIAAHIEKEPEQQPEPEPEIEEPTGAAPPDAAPAAAPGPPAAPAWAAGGEVATATLGELYLRQGHASEAERIFGEVVRREPGNALAHEGLARARDLREPARESAAAPESPEESAAAPALPAPIPLDRKAKKMQALSSYLDRIRRGSGRHVS